MHHAGDDLSVVNAAKVSFSRRSESVGPSEVSLINYLARGVSSKDWEALIKDMCDMRNPEAIEEMVLTLRNMATHWTPFSHNSITLRMKAPIPIRTQCFKHKVGFTENEESRRYISSRPELFIPFVFRSKAKNVKQGSGDTHPDTDKWRKTYVEHCTKAIFLYEEMVADALDEKGEVLQYGISPEQARFILPQGVNVNWIWTGNLAAYARYYNQRVDPHAQKESQLLARKVGSLIQPLFPHSWKALTQK